MKRLLLLIGGIMISGVLVAQSFEVTGLQDSYKGTIGDLIRAPLRLKNNTEKTITLILRKVETQIGSTQKNYFCIDNNCLDQRTEDHILKIEPGQTLQNFAIALEAGLVEGFSEVKYVVYNKSNPSESLAISPCHLLLRASLKKAVFTGQNSLRFTMFIPNPVTDHANIDYQLHDHEWLKPKLLYITFLEMPL